MYDDGGGEADDVCSSLSHFKRTSYDGRACLDCGMLIHCVSGFNMEVPVD